MPGMRMSTIAQPAQSSRAAARKSSALAKTAVAWPFRLSRSARESRTDGSSSTM